jgi:hypothetical protein
VKATRHMLKIVGMIFNVILNRFECHAQVCSGRFGWWMEVVDKKWGRLISECEIVLFDPKIYIFKHT